MKFKPFANNTDSLVFTDDKGNEFNVENGQDKIVVYGQLEGFVDSENYQSLVELFSNIKLALAKYKLGDSKLEKTKISLKNEKFLIKTDVEIGKNEEGLGFISQILSKLK